MKKALYFYIISLLAFGNQSNAQPFTSSLRFTNFTVAEGLPANRVNDVMQDSRGFLWFSTGQGLARYDGIQFKVYRHNSFDKSTMPFDDVIKSIELNNKELLLLSGRSIWMLNPINGQQHAPPSFWQRKGLANVHLLNKYLLAISIGEITFITNLNLQILDSIRNPINSMASIFHLGNNVILFTSSVQAFAYSLTNKKMTEWNLSHLTNSQPSIYFMDDIDTLQKQIFIRHGKYPVSKMSYDIKAPDYLQPKAIFPELKSINGCIFYENGTFIMPNDGKLAIKKNSDPFYYVQHIPGNSNSILPTDQTVMFFDRRANYWSASDAGISRFNLQQLNYKYWKLPYPAEISKYAKFENKLWMSDMAHGSCYLDLGTQIFHILDSSFIRYCWGAVPVNHQIFVHGSSIGNLPSSLRTKLLIYNPQTKSITNPSFLNAFTSGKELVTLVYQAKNGDIWYSINGGGGLVRQAAGTQSYTQYNPGNTPSFHFRYVNKAAEDKKGNVYFSVNKKNEVLVWKNVLQNFEEWKIDSLVQIKNIHFGPLQCHIIDNQQNLWISYEQGSLVKYNLESHNVKIYTSEDGLPTNIFDNMVSDADGNLWIPSPKGLYCLLANTNKFIGFTEKDGLPFTDFSGSTLFSDHADTSLYFSHKGLLFKIGSDVLLMQKIQSTVKLFIEEMKVNNQFYYFTEDEPISLQHNENNLQFTFTLLDLDNKISERKFEFLLKRNSGKAQWQNLQGLNTVVFSSLNPGDYSLEVRLQNELDNGYTYGSNIIHFSISTVWYNTIWFRLVVIVFATAVVWAFIRLYYQRKLVQQQAILDKQSALEAERTRIAADMHDDVGAGLSRIRYITSALKEGKEISMQDMDKIMTLSDESVEKMNEIIWSLNQGNRNLEELMYHIRSQCATMVSNADLEFICELPASIPQMDIGWSISRNIYLLAREAVNNAIKHAGASAITLEFSFDNKCIMTVTDNGKGFNPALAVNGGNGLKHYEKRTSALNGSSSIESFPGKGTKVIFRFVLSQ